MFNLVVFLLFVCSAWTKQACNADGNEKLKERGVTPSKQGEFIELFNKHRNEVAMGRTKNWDNKFQTSALMYFIKWDHKLASLAQECADVCPAKFNIDCKIPSNHGMVFFAGDVWNGGAEWHVDRILKGWAYDKEMSRQIEKGDLTHFGCGRAQIERKRIASEVVVCVFDRKVAMHGDVYKLGMPGNSCPHGLKKGFLGLCRHSATDMSVLSHHIHKHHK